MYLSLRYITIFQYFITSYYYNMMHYYYYFILLQYLLLLNTTSLLLITCKHPFITKQQVLGEITTWLLPLLHYLHYYKPQLLRITTITSLFRLVPLARDQQWVETRSNDVVIWLILTCICLLFKEGYVSTPSDSNDERDAPALTDESPIRPEDSEAPQGMNDGEP